jgi:hypothetical protein
MSMCGRQWLQECSGVSWPRAPPRHAATAQRAPAQGPQRSAVRRDAAPKTGARRHHTNIEHSELSATRSPRSAERRVYVRMMTSTAAPEREPSSACASAWSNPMLYTRCRQRGKCSMHEYAASTTAIRPIGICVYTELHSTSRPRSACTSVLCGGSACGRSSAATHQRMCAVPCGVASRGAPCCSSARAPARSATTFCRASAAAWRLPAVARQRGDSRR